MKTIEKRSADVLEFFARKELSFGGVIKFNSKSLNDKTNIRGQDVGQSFVIVWHNIRNKNLMQSSEFRRIKIILQYANSKNLLEFELGSETKMDEVLSWLTVIGHPVMIGDVLRLMPDFTWGDLVHGEHPMNVAICDLIHLWYQCRVDGECAINRSLDEIFGKMNFKSHLRGITLSEEQANSLRLLEFLEKLIK